ncbi:hypothetical protein A6U87_06410 [Rhizobium sp. AC44/96]|uniref:flagellin N-terminal helical domain-containing protein n=1 Tax=Rhizobium sp. AC44/96 TaxID=1841654 RepID=UPI00080F71AD|nr:flagellin [Rhizobium sp. AC44/96]OCJ12932.1 hypothetical protein A6U87_06410 [Rhizobium sp. AC44/96]
MTSILTNTSAIAALQTLRSINYGLQGTQGRVSSGLRVEKASDNAAYWSIATTMRSDGKAMSAVTDALGMSSAKVDTAYSAMSSVVDLLGEFKAKLVVATEDGVDRTKVQDELDQLKQQVVSVAQAASFNGVNWLNTDILDMEDPEYSLTNVVSSFVRSGGSVSLETVDVDQARTALFNTSGKGILQAEAGGPSALLGGLERNPTASGSWGRSYHFPGDIVFSPSDTLTFDLTLDANGSSAGQTYNVTIDYDLINRALHRNDGQIPGPGDLQTVLWTFFQENSVPATTSSGGSIWNNIGYVTIWSLGVPGEPENDVQISNVSSSLPGGNGMGLENASTGTNSKPYASGSVEFREPFLMSDTDSISFDLQVSDGTAVSYTLTRADVEAALGNGDGIIATSSDMATLLSYKLAGQGLVFTGGSAGVSISVDPSVHPETGSHSNYTFSNVHGSVTSSDLDFLSIDVTGSANVGWMLVGLEGMLQDVVAGASYLGAMEKRIDLQSEFSLKMTDTIAQGVGRLVDADMEEESSRLAAQQTQQQLAIQSLSIANAAPKGVLTLFG